MTNYTIVYYGEPKFESPEVSKGYMAIWRDWMTKIGDNIVDAGVPFSKVYTVLEDSKSEIIGADRISGFTTIKADNIEDAIKLTQSCPHLKYGRIDIAENMTMEMM
jgi:hypothetical protein